MADRGKDDHVVLRTQVVFLEYCLRADVAERYACVVEGIAPPAFSLCCQPRMHNCDARSRHTMCRHQWRCTQSRRIKRKIVQDSSYAVVRSTSNQQGTRGEVFSPSLEGFFCCFDLCVLQLVNQREQRNLTGICDGDN